MSWRHDRVIAVPMLPSKTTRFLGEHPKDPGADFSEVYPARRHVLVRRVHRIKLWIGSEVTPATAEADESPVAVREIADDEEVRWTQNRLLAQIQVVNAAGETVEEFYVHDPGVVRRTAYKIAIGGRLGGEAMTGLGARMLLILEGAKSVPY